MPSRAYLNFTALTDARIAFANVAAWNTYFGSIYVDVTAATLPVPTATTLGGVMSLELVAFAAPVQANGYTTLVIDDGGTTQDVPTRAAYEALATQVQYLVDYVTLLKTQLDAKGYTI